MKENQSYRAIAALSLAALLGMVFFYQSIHAFSDHHVEEHTCDIDRVHLHAESHQHLSCSLCLFRFSPTELEGGRLSIAQPDIPSFKVVFSYQERPFIHQIQQFWLRGPPTIFS